MLVEVKDIVNGNFLMAKRLRHLVNSSRFEKAISKATPEQLTSLKDLVKGGDLKLVKEFINKTFLDELEAVGVSKLRAMAQQYKVKDYYLLTRDQLIERIKDAKAKYPTDVA